MVSSLVFCSVGDPRRGLARQAEGEPQLEREGVGGRAPGSGDAKDTPSPRQLIELGLEDEWLEAVSAVGVTAGASAPEVLVQEVINKLEHNYDARVIQEAGHTENVSFQLPRELR